MIILRNANKSKFDSVTFVVQPPMGNAILTSAILSKRANKSFRIFTSCCADVLLANSVNPCDQVRVNVSCNPKTNEMDLNTESTMRCRPHLIYWPWYRQRECSHFPCDKCTISWIVHRHWHRLLCTFPFECHCSRTSAELVGHAQILNRKQNEISKIDAKSRRVLATEQ